MRLSLSWGIASTNRHAEWREATPPKSRPAERLMENTETGLGKTRCITRTPRYTTNSKASAPKPASSWARFTAGAPKALTLPISRRPEPSSTRSPDDAVRWYCHSPRVRTLSAGLVVYRIGSDGTLDCVRKYDIDTGQSMQFWSGMVTLA
jgi:hypothetical protein